MITYQLWKELYRLRIVQVLGVSFDETAKMIADDRTLYEIYEDGHNPFEAADVEMSYWSD